MSKIFKGRPVVPGEARAKALVSHEGFNTLASFQKSLLAKKTQAVCSDQNNADLYGKVMTGTALCLPQTIGSTTGGMVLHTACSMGAAPAAMLFSLPIDSLAAAGAILADGGQSGRGIPRLCPGRYDADGARRRHGRG